MAALFELSEGALGASDVVGGFAGSGYAGPVVFGLGQPSWFAGGDVADVGQVGLGGIHVRLGLDGA